ncbi:MAG TPA: two-component regulator propeller domain-containing protein, partial [Mycobacterium sp.]
MLSASPFVVMSASGTISLHARTFRRVARVLALACTLGLPASASAQRLQFSKITADDGLAGPWVASIYQDSRGFMWFGTRRGLDRFDGYTIRNFRKIRDDSTSI